MADVIDNKKMTNQFRTLSGRSLLGWGERWNGPYETGTIATIASPSDTVQWWAKDVRGKWRKIIAAQQVTPGTATHGIHSFSRSLEGIQDLILFFLGDFSLNVELEIPEPGKHPNSVASRFQPKEGRVKQQVGCRITPTAKAGLMAHGGVSPVVDAVGTALSEGDDDAIALVNRLMG